MPVKLANHSKSIYNLNKWGKEREEYTLIHYFEMRSFGNVSFFKEKQFDVDGQITNIFWMEHKIFVDYDLFGDVVYFDSMY